MGTQPTAQTRVRVVLPNDKLLRVPITESSTTRDLLVDIKRRCTNDLPSSEVPVNAAPSALPLELVLVRCGIVFQEKQFLQDVGVRDGDILEWRVVADPSQPRTHGFDRGDGSGEGLETGSPGDDEEESSQEIIPHLNTVPQRETKEFTRRRLRPRHQISVGIPRRASPTAQKKLTHHQLTLRRNFMLRDEPLPRFMPRDFFLRVALECLDRLASIQSLSRQLLLQIRDLSSRPGLQLMDQLFPLAHALARETSELIRSDPDTASSLSIQWLYPLIARSIRGTELPVVMAGYVDVVEWIALWRNQRRVYACLCDGATLLFFASKQQCDEFIFERTMRGNDTTILTRNEEIDHKRILKDNAPQTSIDLVASQWNVRKGDGLPTRYAFALFDKSGKLRLIMDVTSQHEADQWIVAIKNETSQSELLTARFALGQSTVPSHRFSVTDLTVPLRWLHSHVDSQSRGRARMERAKSWTLTQALKDLRRDRLCINGIVYNGLCIEEIVGAVLMEITRFATAIAPMDVFHFTRLLLVTSSRTQGGGDILDAMQVAVGTANDTAEYCFCPVEAACREPIRIEIALDEINPNSCVVVARIRMEMAYRVLTSLEISGDDSPHGREPDDALLLRGVYSRQLRCSADEWNRLDGAVAITVEAKEKHRDDKGPC